MTLKRRLQEAIEVGEVVKVKYDGGSQPGSVRQIAPIRISNDKVVARCVNSGVDKTFVLKKMTIVEGEMELGTLEWRPDVKPLDLRPLVHYENIVAVFERKKDYLEGLGWHVENGKACLSLHMRYNGRPAKGYEVSLDYELYSYDLVLGLDGKTREENRRKKQRPWRIRGKGQNTKSFGSLDKAARLFLDWAKLLAPCPK